MHVLTFKYSVVDDVPLQFVTSVDAVNIVSAFLGHS